MAVEIPQIERQSKRLGAHLQVMERWLLDKALLLKGIGIDDSVDFDERWRRGEDLLMCDAALAYEFAADYICGRFPEAEKAIAQSPFHAYSYAKNVLKARFPLAEKNIAQDPHWAAKYASDVIKGRFIEAEQIIIRQKDSALDYACSAVKGQFESAESIFAANAMAAFVYASIVLNSRFAAGEQVIAKEGPSGYSKRYCELFSKLFDENAAALCPYWAYRYAKDVVKGKLPPRLHQKMQLWALSDEHKGNRHLQRYLTSKKYQ